MPSLLVSIRRAVSLCGAALLSCGAWSAQADTISVTTTADVVDAATPAQDVTIASLPGPDGVISLREAICAANNRVGTDTITFAVNGIFSVTNMPGDDQNAGGDFDITDSLIIQGNGTGPTVLKGSADRVLDFQMTGGSLELSNLTVEDGNTHLGGPTNGAGLHVENNSSTTITDCRFSSNDAQGSGGAIYTTGPLTITRSTIDDNRGVGGGGGIYASGNSAIDINISESAITRNRSNNNGGGCVIGGTQTKLTITNSTLAGNTAFFSGGGLHLTAKLENTLNNVTVTNNNGYGGGINLFNTNLTLQNSLVADNFGPQMSSIRTDVSGDLTVSSAYNLISDGTGTNLTNGVNGNQVGSSANPIDARLRVLGNYGGPTETIGLRDGSPALDQGSAAGGVTTDQRGKPRPVQQLGGTSAQDGSDIGALEAGSPVQNSGIVSSHQGDAGLAVVNDLIYVSFATAESVPTPTVTIAGMNASVSNSFGNTWQAFITVVTGTTNGLATYSISFTDSEGDHTVNFAPVNSVRVDTVTLAPTLTAPASSVTTSSPVGVSFSLPETALAGSVKLAFRRTSDQTLVSELQLAAAFETTAPHAFIFKTNGPVDSSGGAVTSGAIIPDGSYTVILTYQDLLQHAATEAASTAVVIDTEPPQIEAVYPFTILAGQDGMTVVGNHHAKVKSKNSEPLTIVQTPAVTDEVSLGEYPITWTVSDAAGNVVEISTTFRVIFGRVDPPGETVVTAESGTEAPGAGMGEIPEGAVLGTFGAPAMSDDRDLVTKATLHVGKKKLQAIYQQDAFGEDVIRAFQGGKVPGPDGSDLDALTFKSFLDPIIAPGGAIAFQATVTGAKSGVDQGVWTDAFGSLALVLREGSDVPGLGLKLKSVTSLSLQDGVLIALVKLMPVKNEVFSGKNDVALVALTGVDTGRSLLRTGFDFPDSKVKTITTLAPALGSNGQGRWHAGGRVLFKATLLNKQVYVMTLDQDGDFDNLISTDSSADPVDPAARWKSFAVPVMGGEGKSFAVNATLVPKLGGVTTKDDVAVLFSADGNGWDVVAREGGLTPLSGDPEQVRYLSFFDPVTNELGRMAILATLQGKAVKSTNKTVLFSGNPHNLLAVARLGETVPDEAGDPTTALWNKFLSYAMTRGEGDQGNVIVLAETKGGDTPKKGKLGLWAADSTGLLRRLLRTGEALEDDGPLMTGLSLLTATPGSYGVGRSYNSTGSVTLLVTFADKSQKLLRLDIP